MLNLMSTLGWIGVALIFGAFFLNSHGYVGREAKSYLLMNIIGSMLFGLDLYFKMSWSGVALQTAWIIIALSAMLRPLMRREATAR